MPRLLHILFEHAEAELVVLLVGAAATADTPEEVNEVCLEYRNRLRSQNILPHEGRCD